MEIKFEFDPEKVEHLPDFWLSEYQKYYYSESPKIAFEEKNPYCLVCFSNKDYFRAEVFCVHCNAPACNDHHDDGLCDVCNTYLNDDF